MKDRSSCRSLIISAGSVPILWIKGGAGLWYGIKDAVGDGPGQFVKTVVEDGIVAVVVDKADLCQYGRHLCPVQDDQIGTFADTMVDEAELLKIFIDVFRHSCSCSVAVVYNGFNSGILVGVYAGIAVYGEKIVGAGFVGFFRFEGGTVVNIGGTGINDVYACIFQKAADCEGKAEGVVFFLPAVVGCAGVGAAVSCVQYDGVWHGYYLLFV